MVQFVTILLVSAAATIVPVLAAPVPAAGGTTLSLAAREPEVYERAPAFEGDPLQRREVDALMDFVERSIEDALDLEQREETDGVELEEREFDDGLEERSFEDSIELDEREVADADAVELDARAPKRLMRPKRIPNPFQNSQKAPTLSRPGSTSSRPRPIKWGSGAFQVLKNLFKKKS